MEEHVVRAFNTSLMFLSGVIRDETALQDWLVAETRKLLRCGQYGAAWICILDVLCSKLRLMDANRRTHLAHFCAAKFPSRMTWSSSGNPIEYAQYTLRIECKVVLLLQKKKYRHTCIVILGIRKSRASVWTRLDRFLVRALCVWIWRQRNCAFKVDGGVRYQG